MNATVYAAGAILWREEMGVLKVCLVHRSRYNDWAWPKGKLDPGEVLPQTAVREIREETGLSIKLGLKLPVQEYTLPNGRPKEVHYWLARVSDKALANSKFKPDEEVAEVAWLTIAEARERMTYPDDQVYLNYLEQYASADQLNTKPFIVLRHAKATPRTDWKKGEETRPLLPLGFEQAKAIVPLLAAFGIKRVVTSPWARCLKTVEPFALKYKLPIVKRHQATEKGNEKGPQRTKKVVRDLIEAGKPTVLCSHRPALPSILEAVSENASPAFEILIHEARALKPGHMMVIHLTVPKNAKEKRQVVAVESHGPAIDD